MEKKRYGKVDARIMLDESLSNGAKLLYAALTIFCNKKRECYPSIDTLLRVSGMTKTTFYKHMKSLEEKRIVIKSFVKTDKGNFDTRLMYKICDFEHYLGDP